MMDGLFIFDLTFLGILPTMTFHPRFLKLPLHGLLARMQLRCIRAHSRMFWNQLKTHSYPHSHSEVS